MNKQIITVIDAPTVSLSENDNPVEAVKKFYRELGWNGEDILDPCKVRTTKPVFDSLLEIMDKQCPNHPEEVGITMVSIGPSADDYIPNGKVYLFEGWIKPAEPK